MPTVSDPYPNFVNGVDTADGDQVDARFAALYALVNGLLDHDNIAAGGITSANLASAVLNGFLKLLVPGDLHLAYGLDVSAATLTDASTLSATVAHGLAGTPKLAVAMPRPGGLYGGALHFSGIGARDGTNVQFDFGGQSFIGGNVIHFDWLAIA